MSLKLLSIKLKINNKKFVQSFTFNLFNLYVNFYCLLIYTKSNDIDKIKILLFWLLLNLLLLLFCFSFFSLCCKFKIKNSDAEEVVEGNPPKKLSSITF